MKFKHWLEAIQTAPFVVTIRYNTKNVHTPDPEDALEDDYGSDPYISGQKYKREEYQTFEDAAAAFKHYIGQAAQREKQIQVKMKTSPNYADHVSLTQFTQGGFAPRGIDLAWWNIGDGPIRFGPSLKNQPEVMAALKAPMDHVGMFNKFAQPIQPGELGPTDKTVRVKLHQKDLDRETPTNRV